MVTIIKGSTKRGQALYARACNKEGYRLSDVYGKFSSNKQAGWNYCFRKYLETPKSCEFQICSHNTNKFSVSWRGEYNGEPAMFLETADNSYVILINK